MFFPELRRSKFVKHEYLVKKFIFFNFFVLLFHYNHESHNIFLFHALNHISHYLHFYNNEYYQSVGFSTDFFDNSHPNIMKKVKIMIITITIIISIIISMSLNFLCGN